MPSCHKHQWVPVLQPLPVRDYYVARLPTSLLSESRRRCVLCGCVERAYGPR
jgi:hypothetical protein